MTPSEMVITSPEAEMLVAALITVVVVITVWGVISWFEGRALDEAIREYRKSKQHNAVMSAIADQREAEQRKNPCRAPAVVVALVILAMKLRKARR